MAPHSRPTGEHPRRIARRLLGDLRHLVNSSPRIRFLKAEVGGGERGSDGEQTPLAVTNGDNSPGESKPDAPVTQRSAVDKG